MYMKAGGQSLKEDYQWQSGTNFTASRYADAYSLYFDRKSRKDWDHHFHKLSMDAISELCGKTTTRSTTRTCTTVMTKRTCGLKSQ